MSAATAVATSYTRHVATQAQQNVIGGLNGFATKLCGALLSSGHSEFRFPMTSGSKRPPALLHFHRSRSLRPSVHPGRLQQLRAIGGDQHHVEGIALAVQRQRHLDAGGAQCPQAAVKFRGVGHRPAADRENDVAGADLGAGGGALARRIAIGFATR